MTTVSILPETGTSLPGGYRAIAGARNSRGPTAGAALDALSAQLDDEEAGTLVVVQNMKPDRFFTAAQQARLKELFDAWRTARDSGGVFPDGDRAELEALTMTELKASGSRAKALFESATP
jgi:hypothetical protein